MILVDSSVWIDYFRNRPTRQVAHLEQQLDRERVLIGDLVLTEVLQGAPSDKAFNAIKDRLSLAKPLQVTGEHVAIEAARHYRTLRTRGITIRKTIDTLIATRCILDGLPLLYSDRDFDPFVEHLGLLSVMTDPTGVN